MSTDNVNAEPNAVGDDSCAEPFSLRIRRDWNKELSDYDRALYLDAVETAIERGLHQRFVQWHADLAVHVYAHETCAFFLWHRRFTYAYESMLRSLGPPRFRCVTIPFWDIPPEYQDQEDGTFRCRQYGTCSPIIHGLGGQSSQPGLEDYVYRTVEGVREIGWIHDRPPLQNFYDDNLDKGIVRFDMGVERIPIQASLEEVAKLYSTNTDSNNTDSVSSTLAFWRRLQLGIHDHIHATVGGFMRSRSSPVDPVFFPLHATIDLLGYFWEVCHDGSHISVNHDTLMGGNPADLLPEGTQLDNMCLYTPDAKQNFAPFSFDPTEESEAWYNVRNFTSDFSMVMGIGDPSLFQKYGKIENDPIIGQYFQLDSTERLDNQEQDKLSNWWNLRDDSELDPFHLGYSYSPDAYPDLQEVLQNSASLCPSGIKGRLLSPFNDSFISERNMNHTTPMFTPAEILNLQEEWMERATMIWRQSLEGDGSEDSNGGSLGDREGNTDKLERYQNYAKCILESMDYDTLERWAIDDAFVPLLTSITPRKSEQVTIIHLPCHGILSHHMTPPPSSEGIAGSPLPSVALSGCFTKTPRQTGALSFAQGIIPGLAPIVILTCWLLGM
jgi:hypothetical protein